MLQAWEAAEVYSVSLSLLHFVEKPVETCFIEEQVQFSENSESLLKLRLKYL